jgi:hypothetical protein
MIHIQRFIDRLQGFEARGTKDFIMSVKDAKDLHADITRLLLSLETAREAAEKSTQDQVITVEVGGGSF